MAEQQKSWSLSSAWNESLSLRQSRPLQERSHIYASELGSSLYERYLKMYARPMTTPPNSRAMRKFYAGDVMETIVHQVLRYAGILKSTQDYIVNEEGPLKVTGRCDFIAGGEIKSVNLDELFLPDSIRSQSEDMLRLLQEKYPEGFNKQILEIKSCSSMMFDRYEKAPSIQHALQAFHYAYNMNLPAHLVYLCKDDMRSVEWVVLPGNERYKQLYFEDIDRMAKAYELPLKEAAEQLREPLLLFEDGKFSKNWRVEYSSYLTDYGFERPDEYSDQAKIATRLNNVIKRLKEGKQLTANNLEALRLGIQFWPEVRNIMKEYKV